MIILFFFHSSTDFLFYFVVKDGRENTLEWVVNRNVIKKSLQFNKVMHNAITGSHADVYGNQW